MIKSTIKSPESEEEQQCETDLVFLLNCYKSREESAHSIREFYGKFNENRLKFPNFDTLQKKILYFSDEFIFHDRVVSMTEDEISSKYMNSKTNTMVKKQLLSKFVNNIFKINSVFINKLNHGNYDEDVLRSGEYGIVSNLFRENALSILKEENLNIFKLMNFIIKTSRAKLQNEIKKLKSVFLSNQTKTLFETKNSAQTESEPKKNINSPLRKKNNSRKKSKSQKKVGNSLLEQTFKVDAFQFLDSVRRKYIMPNSLNLPMSTKKNGKLIVNQNLSSNSKVKSNKKQKSIVQMPIVYNILQISDLKTSIHLSENPNELITEKFERMFTELMKANSGTSQTLKKYHEDFMKHIERKKINFNERSFLGVRNESVELKQDKPKSEAKIEDQRKDKFFGNRRSTSVTKN